MKTKTAIKAVLCKTQHHFFLALVISLICVGNLEAQTTVNIYAQPDGGGPSPVSGLFATGWVSVNGTNKNSGNLTVALNSTVLNNETAGRGWMRFSLSSAGIPGGATITSVTLTRQVVSAIYSQTIKGYATTPGSVSATTPDPIVPSSSGLPNTTLYSALSGVTWNSGSLNAANPRDLGTNGINAVQNYINGGIDSIIVLGFPNISSIGSTANIAGYDNANVSNRPFLSITYTTSSAPVANFTASTSTICEGGTISYTDLSTNSPTSWSWSFAGGNPSSSALQSPGAITYNSAGTYSVTLTASNSNGSASFSINVTVNPIPATPVITLSATGDTLFSSAPSGNQWYLNGNPIVGATLSFYVPTTGGNYTVETTVSGCSATSSPYNFIPTTVQSNQDAFGQPVIFPNPARNEFVIQGLNPEVNNVELFDMCGRKILTVHSTNDKQAVFNVSFLESGLYLIQITEKNKKYFLQLIRE